MGTIELKLVDDHAPQAINDFPEWLRTMACVHPHTGERRLPTAVDDAVFDQAADFIEKASVQVARMQGVIDQINDIEQNAYSLRDCDQGMKAIRKILADYRISTAKQ